MQALWSEVSGSLVPFRQAYFLPAGAAGKTAEGLLKFAKLAAVPAVPDPPHLPAALAAADPASPPNLLSPAQVTVSVIL